MAEITTAGVTGTSLAEYLQRVRDKYLAIDPLWNIEPESPDGMAIAIWSELLANLDEQVVYAYQSLDPLTARGRQLERIAFFNGIRKRRATASTSTVVLRGVEGTPVGFGTLIRNKRTGTLWSVNSDVTLAAGPAAVGVTCLTLGPEPAAPGDLSIIATPVGGLQSVTNETAASLGLPEESDEQFRARRTDSVALGGSNQLDNLVAAVGAADGVKQVRIYENEEGFPDSNGLAPNSMAIIVDGGSDSAVLKAIASRKNPGCGLNRYSEFPGKVNGDTTTPRGQPVNITFFRADLVSPYVRVGIGGGALSEQDKQRIRKAMVAYSLNGFMGTTDGFRRYGWRIGEDVAAGPLYTPVNQVIAGNGFVQSIKLGLTSGAINQDILPMAFNQLGVLDESRILVEYV